MKASASPWHPWGSMNCWRRVDYVKLDIEGAEMKLLAAPRDWKNVERLVVEWSFHEGRALAPFLEGWPPARRGFTCAYDGRGTWDQESGGRGGRTRRCLCPGFVSSCPVLNTLDFGR